MGRVARIVVLALVMVLAGQHGRRPDPGRLGRQPGRPLCDHPAGRQRPVHLPAVDHDPS